MDIRITAKPWISSAASDWGRSPWWSVGTTRSSDAAWGSLRTPIRQPACTGTVGWAPPVGTLQSGPAQQLVVFDYAGGMMTNWAIHHIDVILWSMQVANPTAVSCSGGKFVVDDLADTPDTIAASWEFPAL